MKIFTTTATLFCSSLLVLHFLLGTQEVVKGEEHSSGALHNIYNKDSHGVTLTINIQGGQEKKGEENRRITLHGQSHPLMVWNTINPLFQPSFDVIVCS